MVNKLNLRVYGILFHQKKLLTIKETYAGEKVIKFPGGGLELGEGIKNTLEREFIEELNLKVRVIEPFYVQDFFLKSKVVSTEQLITLYYLVQPIDIENLKIMDSDIEEIVWIPIEFIKQDVFSLPVDKIVSELIISKNGTFFDK